MIKFILLIILFSFSFSFELIDDSMNINDSQLSVESSAMGNVYRPFDIKNKILTVAHLSKFGGIYTLDVIRFNYNENNILFTSHGVNDIPNTTQALININDNGPTADEIDYSKIF